MYNYYKILNGHYTYLTILVSIPHVLFPYKHLQIPVHRNDIVTYQNFPLSSLKIVLMLFINIHDGF